MRAKIQNTALSLFGREGFENVSVEEIAQTVGCSVGNIYHYFKSKDELAIQVTQMVDRAYAEMEQEYLSDGDTPAREKLLDFVGKALEISASDEMLYKAFIHGLRYPEQAVLQKNDKRVYYRLLRELVDLCQEEGSIHPSYDPDCRDRGVLVIMCSALCGYHIHHPGPRPSYPQTPACAPPGQWRGGGRCAGDTRRPPSGDPDGNR